MALASRRSIAAATFLSLAVAILDYAGVQVVGFIQSYVLYAWGVVSGSPSYIGFAGLGMVLFGILYARTDSIFVLTHRWELDFHQGSQTADVEREQLLVPLDPNAQGLHIFMEADGSIEGTWGSFEAIEGDEFDSLPSSGNDVQFRHKAPLSFLRPAKQRVGARFRESFPNERESFYIEILNPTLSAEIEIQFPEGEKPENVRVSQRKGGTYQNIETIDPTDENGWVIRWKKWFPSIDDVYLVDWEWAGDEPKET